MILVGTTAVPSNFGTPPTTKISPDREQDDEHDNNNEQQLGYQHWASFLGVTRVLQQAMCALSGSSLSATPHRRAEHSASVVVPPVGLEPTPEAILSRLPLPIGLWGRGSILSEIARAAAHPALPSRHPDPPPDAKKPPRVNLGGFFVQKGVDLKLGRTRGPQSVSRDHPAGVRRRDGCAGRRARCSTAPGRGRRTCRRAPPSGRTRRARTRRRSRTARRGPPRAARCRRG